MATDTAWFKVPSAIRFVLTGALPPRVSGKDVKIEYYSEASEVTAQMAASKKDAIARCV